MEDNTHALSKPLLITGCAELLTLRGPWPRRGKNLSQIGLVPDGALLVSDGKIVAVGRRRDVARHALARRAEKLDLGGRVVLPGFVDSHTHLVFPASRAHEHEKRVAGCTYEEIARSGGGILSSVRDLRRANPAQLAARALTALERFAQHGTTTLEAKSGYGLDAASELKILRLHRVLTAGQPLEIVSTFLGAHVVPPEYRKRKGGADAYVDFLVRQLIPQVAKENLAEFCDVYLRPRSIHRRAGARGAHRGTRRAGSRRASTPSNSRAAAARGSPWNCTPPARTIWNTRTPPTFKRSHNPTPWLLSSPDADSISAAIATRPPGNSSRQAPSSPSHPITIPAPAPRSTCP